MEEDLESIEGMALDWMSGTLFWVDAVRKRIELAKIHNCFNTSACDRRVLLNGNFSKLPDGRPLFDRPRAIVLFPKFG